MESLKCCKLQYKLPNGNKKSQEKNKHREGEVGGGGERKRGFGSSLTYFFFTDLVSLRIDWEEVL